MTKAFCTEMQVRVVDRCMSVHGAMGLTNELRLEEAFRFVELGLRVEVGHASGR